jgi:hypothetical protein
MSRSRQVGLPKLSRRQSLQLGTATAAASLLTTRLAIKPVEAKDLPPGPYTTPFVVPLPVYQAKQTVSALTPPPVEQAGSGECGWVSHQRWSEFQPQKFYTLNVREALHSFHRELPTQKIWGYDGLLPGPTFVERYGVPIIVRIQNDLPANTVGFGSPEITTHLHNLYSAPANTSEGGTQND